MAWNNGRKSPSPDTSNRRQSLRTLTGRDIIQQAASTKSYWVGPKTAHTPGSSSVNMSSMDGAQCSVLIADDDAAIRYLLSYALRDVGYIVDTAPDGELALARLRTSSERLVALIDLRLPKMDGVEVMRAVVADNALTQRHAYILLTAQEEWIPPLLRTVLTKLHAPILAKPIHINHVLDKVRQAEQRLKLDAS